VIRNYNVKHIKKTFVVPPVL